MASAAYDLATYLQANGFGTVGKDIFVNVMDDKLDPSLTLMDYTGEPASRTINGGKIQSSPKVQALFRSQNSKGSHVALESIYSFLDGKAEVTINGSRYMLITALHEPVPLSRDEKDMVVYVVNFSCRRVSGEYPN